WISQAGSGPQAPVHGGPGGRTRDALWAAAVLLLLASTGTLFWLWSRGRTDEPPLMRLSMQPPAKADVTGTLALSPDGRRIAFVATDDSGTSRLWIRPLDSSSATPLPGTDDARFPFWSPDSRSVAFFGEGKLRRVSVSGGDVQPLCDITDFRGGAWGVNGD